MTTPSGKHVWLLAEYCAADLFTGWHLYERDRNDGSRNDDGGWGWLRNGDMVIRRVAALLPELPQPPAYGNTSNAISWGERFSGAFGERYPAGLRVEKVDLYEYALITPTSPLTGESK